MISMAYWITNGSSVKMRKQYGAKSISRMDRATVMDREMVRATRTPCFIRWYLPAP